MSSEDTSSPYTIEEEIGTLASIQEELKYQYEVLEEMRNQGVFNIEEVVPHVETLRELLLNMVSLITTPSISKEKNG